MSLSPCVGLSRGKFQHPIVHSYWQSNVAVFFRAHKLSFCWCLKKTWKNGYQRKSLLNQNHNRAVTTYGKKNKTKLFRSVGYTSVRLVSNNIFIIFSNVVHLFKSVFLPTVPKRCPLNLCTLYGASFFFIEPIFLYIHQNTEHNLQRSKDDVCFIFFCWTN